MWIVFISSSGFLPKVSNFYIFQFSLEIDALIFCLLLSRFSNLLALLQNLDQDGLNLAEEVRARFSNTFDKLVTEALKLTNNFNVICHGKPAPSNFKIRFDIDLKLYFTSLSFVKVLIKINRFSPDGSKVEDTILANFGDVGFGHPLLDVAFLLDVATDAQVLLDYFYILLKYELFLKFTYYLVWREEQFPFAICLLWDSGFLFEVFGNWHPAGFRNHEEWIPQ